MEVLDTDAAVDPGEPRGDLVDGAVEVVDSRLERDGKVDEIRLRATEEYALGGPRLAERAPGGQRARERDDGGSRRADRDPACDRRGH
jgi:hypothetical protein